MEESQQKEASAAAFQKRRELAIATRLENEKNRLLVRQQEQE